MGSQLLSRSKSLPSRLATNTLPLPIFSRHFSGSSENSLTPIKVVCRYDFPSVDTQICRQNWGKVLRRFPLAFPKEVGSTVRRSVCEVRDRAFEKNRFFLFIDVGGFEGLADFQLLYCTRTTKLIGVKRQNKLLIFGDDSFLHTQLFAKIAGVGIDLILHRHFNVPAYPNYLMPGVDGLRSAVAGINQVLDANACKKLLKTRMDHYEDCLALLYCFTFGGLQFRPIFNSVERSLDLGECGVPGQGDRGNAVLLSEKWSEISAEYFAGSRQWQSFVIDKEIAILKFLPEIKVDDQWNNTLPTTEQKKMEDAYDEKLKKLKSGYIRRVAREAWEEAKGGFDEEEFFEEMNFGEEAEAAARDAWKNAIDVYY